MSSSLYLKLVLPRLATRMSMNGLSAKTRKQIWMRPGDDVGGDQLADLAGCLGSGVHGRLHASHVAFDDRRDMRAADGDCLDDLDVGGLAHRVGRLHQSNPP